MRLCVRALTCYACMAWGFTASLLKMLGFDGFMFSWRGALRCYAFMAEGFNVPMLATLRFGSFVMPWLAALNFRRCLGQGLKVLALMLPGSHG